MRCSVKANGYLRINNSYSYLGNRFLSGDVEVAKFFYGNAWKESPPLIKTIEQLQYCLTSVEVEEDSADIFSNEFLYYLGMICIGEVSQLIVKNLETAETCFNKIKKVTPKAEARLAFIKLLLSDEPCKSERNAILLDRLRKWAGKNDFFSRIVLAKIIYYQFLCEENIDELALPTKTLSLLELPCQKGHPVAIKFYNEILNYTSMSRESSMKYYSRSSILYDF